MAAAILGAYLLSIAVGVVFGLWAWSLGDDLARARERIEELEGGAAGDLADDLRSLNDRVRTIGLQLGKVATLGAHSDLCDRVGRLERGLQDMADQWTEPPWGGPPTIPENDPE